MSKDQDEKKKLNVVITPLGECLVAEVEPREHGYVLILYCVGERPHQKAVDDLVGTQVGLVQSRDDVPLDS